MSTKHTSGKWRLEPFGRTKFEKLLAASNDKGQEKICVLDFGLMHTLEEAEANAKLIASAPELLESLADIVRYFEDTSHKRINHLLLDNAITALNKATL